MKQQVDAHYHEVTFTVDDYVFLRLQPYCQKSLAPCQYVKLSTHFFGPYKILHYVGPLAYKLQLPADSKLLPVFHISFLQLTRRHHALTFPILY
ncbi:hypothetical protein V6Z12_D07G023500 [Gossypium hirsutum]